MVLLYIFCSEESNFLLLAHIVKRQIGIIRLAEADVPQVGERLPPCSSCTHTLERLIVVPELFNIRMNHPAGQRYVRHL